MTYISITLDKKSGDEWASNHYKIVRSEQPYEKFFLKTKHEITYLGIYESGYSYWRANYFCLQFRKNIDKKIFYYYYVTKQEHIVRKIEVYFSKLHPKIPLIIGFETNDKKRYFTYNELMVKSSYGFPSGGFAESELKAKLKDENRARNKLKFNIERRQHQAYYITKDDSSYQGFIKYQHSVEDDLKHGNHLMSSEKLFEKEKSADRTFIDTLLSKMTDNVYDFINIYCTEDSKVLLIEFIDDSTKTYFIRKNETGGYWAKEGVKNSSNEELTRELNKIKSSLGNLTFMLDKNTDDVMFKDKISVTKQQKSLGFTIYVHTPTKPQKATVMYKDISFSITHTNEVRDKLQTVQDKSYEKIETYSLNKELNLHLLIKFTLSESKKEHYFKRINKKGDQWEEISNNGYSSSDQKIKDKLLEINYLFNKSLLLKINEISRYNTGLVNNSSSSLSTSGSYVIVSQQSGSCGSYKSYNHSLSASKSSLKDEVVGIRLKFNDHEVKLYDENRMKENIQYIYYEKTKTDFYVYFYDKDTRPLMVCYNNKAYGPTNKENFNLFKFSLVNGISTCPCRNNVTLTNKLNDIYDQLNEVDISKSGEYNAHNYDKKQVKITVKHSTSNCYIRYKHTPSSGNRLGNIIYNNNHIKDNNGNKSITASGSKEVYVYYNTNDNNRKHPLLVALCNSSNCQNTNLYYELQKNDSGQNKIYKKGSQQIRLDESSNVDLYDKLDKIFYNLTKSVCIILNKQPNNYQSNLTCNNKLSQETSINITVEQINCQKLYHSSYKCYQHKITSVANIGDIGGLKFYLWDQENRHSKSKELNLYSDYGGSQKMPNIIYTSCKGNVLVFFYDSDPRPLLLCFDSKWYRPKDKTNYTDKWVRITKLETCKCTEKGFTQASNLLAELNNIYMELNPVDLGETKKAYEQGQVDGYTYIIHNYTPQPIKVKITSENLDCYKKYVHEPENKSDTSYRLGKIHYNSQTNHGLSYSEEKSLQKVLLYYSVYDTEHKHPLLVKLCFKGTSSADTEYHKLEDKVNIKWVKLSSDKHKNLLEKLSKDDTFESGLYDIRTGISINYDEDQKKQYFFKPEKCKEDDINVAAVVGGSVGGGVAGIGGFVGIGLLVFKKIIAASA